MVGGKRSHSCWLSVQTVRTGAGKVGSASAPTATVTMPGRLGRSQYIVEPHWGQNRLVTMLPLSASRLNVRCSPSTVMSWSWRKKACTPNRLAVRRWQARQWQEETSARSPLSRSLSWPQEQAAIRSLDGEAVVMPAGYPPAALLTNWKLDPLR